MAEDDTKELFLKMEDFELNTDGIVRKNKAAKIKDCFDHQPMMMG